MSRPPSPSTEATPGGAGRGWSFFWLYTLPLLVYLAGIAVLSHRPGGGRPWIPHLDKVVHLVLYAPVGFLFVRWYRRWKPTPRMVRRWAIIAAAVFGAAYGVTDELHQSFVPGRVLDPFDALADACGSALGGAVYAWFALRP